MKLFLHHLSIILLGPLVLHILLDHSLDLQRQYTQQRVLKPGDNNGNHLAIFPVCGSLSGKASDVNAGVNLKDIKTIVAFGVLISTPILGTFVAHRRRLGLLHRRGT